MRTLWMVVIASALCIGCTTSKEQPSKEPTAQKDTPKAPETTAPQPPGKKKVVVTRFVSPFKDKAWEANSYKFEEVCEYETEGGGKKNWGRHLGEDCNVKADTKVFAIAPGKVAYASIHPGKSKDARNWGGIVVLGHWISETEALYSLYGHLKLKEGLERGQYVSEGDELGTVAPALSGDNGWWEDAHLHLQICLDPDDVYRGGVLRGYASDKAPTRLEDHMAPSALIRRFKAGMTIKELMK